MGEVDLRERGVDVVELRGAVPELLQRAPQKREREREREVYLFMIQYSSESRRSRGRFLLSVVLFCLFLLNNICVYILYLLLFISRAVLAV